MNHILKTLTIALALSALIVAIGCDDDDSTNSPKPSVPVDLVDTWEWEAAEIDGVPVASFAEVSFSDTGTGQILVFEADGGWVTYELYGTYTVYTMRVLCYDEGDSLRLVVTYDNGNPAPDESCRADWERIMTQYDLRLSQSVIASSDTIVFDAYYVD